jgi:hypothetical protein
MVKTEVIPWSTWRSKEDLSKKEQTQAKVLKVAKKCIPVALTVIAGVTFALHGDFTAFAASGVPDNAVASLAQVAAPAADFGDQLRKATKPIRDIIFAFGHEIYFVMMAWGGIEALIGKTQQGFSRMKASTAAYVVLYWVPWIVETVNAAVPH